MFSLIRKALKKARSYDEVAERLSELEKRLSALEYISDERDSLWLFIEDIKKQEEEACQVLHDELQSAFIRSMKPRGEA